MTLSLGDCARATGLSVKAIRRRIERGTLQSVLVDGRRRIPVSSLVGAGLLVEGLDRGGRGSAQGQVQPAAVVQRLVAQRQRLTEELAVVADLEADVRRIAEQLRRERSRSHELEDELAQARHRITQLERALRSRGGT
jgi:septal ring factor EnvC (AmiA/AmiB activator)